MASRKARGMTIIELMIALAILAILASVAFPLYDRYVTRGYRTQAMADIQACAMAMERFFTVNFTYVGAADDGGGIAVANGPPLATTCRSFSPPNGNVRYNITLAANADTFTATAAAVGSQAADGNLALDATGARFWDRNDDGDYTDAGEQGWNE